MRRAALTGSWACALLLVAAAAPRAARAQEQDLQQIQDDVATVGVQLKTLGGEYNDAKLLSGTRPFAARFTDAEILFLLNDYTRASLVLFDLVNDPRNASQPMYGKALYELAESQYQIGNDLAARELFQRVVARRDPDHLTDAIRRLIQIADRTENWNGLDAHISVLRAHGPLPPSIAYIHAKSLLRQKKYSDVAAAVRDIPKGNRLYPKARYVAAVADVALGHRRAASQIFTELRRLPNSYPDAEIIRELAAMDAGRIFLDQGKVSQSLDSYQYVPRQSPRFDEALYEITWTFVRAADEAKDTAAKMREYTKARQALEILLLSDNETTVAPEARILLGNILLKLKRYKDATHTFQKVVARYAPLQGKLQALAVKMTNPSEYYDEVASRSAEGGSLLPPLAVRWAAKQKTLKKALGVVNDIDRGEKWIDDSIGIIDKLLTVLNSEQRAQFFPQLQAAQAKRLELSNTLVALSKRLLAVERRVVQPELTPAQQAELRDVLAERAKLEPQYLKLPQSQEDYEGRLSSMKQQMLTLQKEVYRLKWSIEEQQRTIDGLRQWMAENPNSMPPKDAATFRQRLDKQQAEVQNLRDLQQGLVDEVDKQKSLISVTTDAQAHEEQLRARYSATLDRERAILAEGLARVAGSDQHVLDRIAKERGVIASYHAELESFQRHLSAVVGKRAADIKAQLLREQGVLASYRDAMGKVRDDAKVVVGEIASASMQQVEKKFRSIVLRGNVGIIDVAWALKESNTHEITHWVKEKRRELDALDSEFKEVLSED